MRGMSQTFPLFFHPLAWRTLIPIQLRRTPKEPQLNCFRSSSMPKTPNGFWTSAQSRTWCVRGGPEHREELSSQKRQSSLQWGACTAPDVWLVGILLPAYRTCLLGSPQGGNCATTYRTCVCTLQASATGARAICSQRARYLAMDAQRSTLCILRPRRFYTRSVKQSCRQSTWFTMSRAVAINQTCSARHAATPMKPIPTTSVPKVAPTTPQRPA